MVELPTEFNQPSVNYSIKIFDGIGQLTQSYNDLSETLLRLDLQGLESGMYLIQIEQDDQIWSKRFIKD